MECIYLLGLHESWIPRAVFDHKDNILKLDHGIKIIHGNLHTSQLYLYMFVTKMGATAFIKKEKGACVVGKMSFHALSF